MDCSTLFPSGVSLVIADEAMWSTPLRDEEDALIVSAVEKRQQEFRAGRHAAHAALDRLGAPDIPILQGKKRNPIWPVGFIGSIAHCRDLCLAVSAVEGEIAGVGVDVEPLNPLPSGVERYIHTQAEARFMQRQATGFPERLVFSAKESLYKCYYPLLESYFGFQSVTLTIDVERRHFGFSPTPECKIEFPAELTFCGRYLWDETHLYTACYLLRA
jgi:enterobactin synthetase component D